MTASVRHTPDIDRVAALPRRVWTPEKAQDVARDMTAAMRQPTGTWSLKPVQALALLEIAQCRGAFLPIRVGGGKTLITALAPQMIPGIKRPLLLVPAHLREKTEAEFFALRRQFKLPPYIRVESYQTLSRVNAATLLQEYRPDMLIADECHYLKNRSAACTKRVHRYLKDNKGAVPFVGMSGTVTKRSIMDFSHIAAWALGDGAPVAHDMRALMEWAAALDVNVADHRRYEPGALERFTGTGNIRRGYARRILETPGVIATQEPPLDVGLHIRSHVIEPPPETAEAWKGLRDKWVTPDGWECADAVEIWRHARELSLGCFYRWNPRPPTEWAMARSAWTSWCRRTVNNNRRNLDTELQVRQAVEEGGYPEAESILTEWLAIRDTFTPNTEAVWISDHALDWISDWARKNTGIIWVSHTHLGAKLEERGIPYYGQQGIRTATGRSIESHAPSEGTIAASVAANATGRNLQAWNRNLIASVPPNGSIWEQLLGRMHRPGQKADTVHVDVMLGCIEDVEGFWRAVNDACYCEDLTGQYQKLTHADTEDVHTVEDMQRKRAAAWRKKKLTA